MAERHEMTLEAATGAEYLFGCPVCGRRLVLQRAGGLVVLDRGDPLALHSGSAGGLSVATAVPREPGSPG